MLNIDILKIRMLVHLAETQSLSKAAQRLGVSPSAVSQSLKLLEQQVEQALFLRVGKRMVPTPVTLELTTRSKQYFDDLECLFQNQNFSPEEIRVGAPQNWGVNVLVEEVGEFLKQNPKVRVSLSLTHAGRLRSELLDGVLDMAFIDESPDLKRMTEIATEPFCAENLLLCGSKKFHERHLKTSNPTLSLLKQCAHIPYTKEKEGVYKWYKHHYGSVPDFKAVMTVDHPLGVKKAILKDLGLGVLPESLVSDNLVVIPGKKKPLMSRVLVAQLKSKVPSRAQKALLQFLAIK